MKRQLTREKLWLIERDVEKINNDSIALSFFLDKQFRSFFQRPGNQKILGEVHSGVHKIQRKYIVHNDKGVPQRKGGDGADANDWIYQESVIDGNGQLLTGDMISQAYINELNAFLQGIVNVEF